MTDHDSLALAHALSGPKLSSLTELDIYWEDAEILNHSFEPKSLLNPQTGADDLSIALRRVAQLPTMKTLKLTGTFILSKEFFNSTRSGSKASEWPSLEVLSLQLSSMAPNGSWYYTGDPDSADSDDDHRYGYDSEEEEEFIDSADSEKEDW